MPFKIETETELSSNSNPEANESEVDLLDLLLTLSSGSKLTLRSVAMTAVLAAIVTYLLPEYFQARMSLLPPQSSQSASSMMAGQLGALTGISTRELGLKNSSDLYVALLSSESVANALIERFRLREVYGVTRMEDARVKLGKRTNISSGKDGLIVVTVEDRDPRRAADIANAYAGALEDLNTRLAISEAAQRRLFFEHQLQEAKSSLAKAELELGQTERRTGMVELGAHAKALVEQIALLRAQFAAKEVAVRGMQSYATEQNPDYRLAVQQLGALRAQLTKLERGDGEGATGSMTKLSGAGVEFANALREVKYQETLFELLSRQYEAARIDEAKEGAMVQVVDRASAPEKRSWPRRSLTIFSATLLAAFVSSAYVLLKSSLRRALDDPARSRKVLRLRESWRAVL